MTLNRRRAAIKASAILWTILLSACASAPQPYCIPPEFTRAPEGVELGTAVPRANNSSEEYARCKEMEADIRLETQLREDEVKARKREAEQLERELEEMQGQEPPS